MNQPQQPGWPAPGGPGQQPQYEVSYPPPAVPGPSGPSYGAPANQPYGVPGQQQYGMPGQQSYGMPPAPKKSMLPIWIAIGLVVALGAGIGLFFLLRDGESPTDPGPTAKTAEATVKEFFTAVDAQDEKGMTDLARGEMLEDIDNIMSTDLEDFGATFAEGSVTDSADQKVADGTITVLFWQLDDPPPGLTADEAELGVLLLDDGDGHKVCYINSTDGDSIDQVIDEHADDYQERCGL